MYAQLFRRYLRNKFNFGSVHGIKNTSGLLQSNFARDQKYSWFYEQNKNLIYCLCLHFITNIFKYIEIIYNLRN